MNGEQAVERYLCRKVKEKHGICCKLTGSNGIPDRLIITNDGRCIFVELKADGGRLSAVQEAVHYNLRSMKQEVYVLWSFEDVDILMDFLFGKHYA